MKTQLLTLISIIFSTIAFCQENGNTTDKIYITNETVIVDEFDITEKQVLTTKYIAVKDTKFTVSEIIDEKLLIKFWNYTDSIKIKTIITTAIPPSSSSGGGPPPPPPVFTPPPAPAITTRTSYKDVSFNTNDKYFLLDLEDYKKKTSEYEYRR